MAVETGRRGDVSNPHALVELGEGGTRGTQIASASAYPRRDMSKVLTSLPVGEKVGIAFSGGLDTSAAVAWMREKGAIPYCYTADLGQPDEPDLDGVPRPRQASTAPKQARVVDCRTELVHEGLVALQCGAFHITTAGKTYFNTTPLGRAVTGTLLVRAMQRRRRRHLGRRQHLQGQRHRALLPLRAAGEPEPAHLQAVARRAVRRRARWPGGDERVPHRRASCRTATARRRRTRTDANIWGATHEAKSLEELGTGMDIVEPIMGVAHYDDDGRDRARGRHDPVRTRAGRWRFNGERVRHPGRRSCSRPTRSAAATGWG